MNSYKKSIICISLLALIFLASAKNVFAATLNELLRQREQLSQDLDKYQSAADNKEKEAKTLSNQISNLDKDISATEKRITETGSEIDQTSHSIEELASNIELKNLELARLKKKLNNAVVEIYRFSSRSDVELLFSSSSLGANSNDIKYVEAIEIQIKSIYSQVQSAKNDLDYQKNEQEKKKNDLNDLRQRQESYKKGAEYQKIQKDKLLGMTVQQKQSYEEQVKKLQSEITHISAEIYANRKNKIGKEILLGGGSGYPYTAIDVPDAWGFLTRECTSYAAWYWNVVLGRDWVNTRPGSGSAYNWPNLAKDQGYGVSSTPRKGAIISWSAGSLTSKWGHVAIVEKVNNDGTIDISEYNWMKFAYSYRKNVNPGDYGSYKYIW